MSLTLKGIVKRDMDNPKGKFPAEFDTYQEVKKQDFVFCLFDVEETPRTIGLSKYDGMITGAYTVMQTDDAVNKDYLYYFYLNLDSKKRLKFLYKGLRNTIPKDSFFSFKTVLPPKQEQIKIASFLDTKTEQLDKAIKQKEQLIELLKERRQILINDAVTKGIDTTVVMKNSGVERIGDIPEHWEVKKMKYFIDIKGGFAFDSAAFNDEGIQIIKIANTYMNKLSLERQPTFAKETYLKSHSSWVVSKGDILMSLTGTMGKRDYGFAILLQDENKYLLNQRVAKLKVKNNMSSGYLLTLLHSDIYLNKLYSLPSGTKQANLSNDNVINIVMPIPPANERIGVLNHIEASNKNIDKAIDLQQQQIIKLKEYKTTLIDSVVTGKVRVNDE